MDAAPPRAPRGHSSGSRASTAQAASSTAAAAAPAINTHREQKTQRAPKPTFSHVTNRAAALDELSRLNISARSFTPRVMADEVLPGIPSRKAMYRSLSAQDAYSTPAYTWEDEANASRRPPVPPRSHSIDQVFRPSSAKHFDPESFGRGTWMDTDVHDEEDEEDEDFEVIQSSQRGGSAILTRSEPVPINDADDSQRRPPVNDRSTKNTAQSQTAPTPSSNQELVPRSHRSAKAGSSKHLQHQSSSKAEQRHGDAEAAARDGTDQSKPLRSSLQARQMLHLMNQTQGWAHGGLYFRKASAGRWLSANCTIDVTTGVLKCVYAQGQAFEETLVPDLRGCSVRLAADPDRSGMMLVLNADCLYEDLYVRPKNAAQLEKWFAALLCWKPVHASQSLGNPRSHLLPTPLPLNSTIPPSENPTKPERSIIKVGKFSLWDRSALSKLYARTASDDAQQQQQQQPPIALPPGSIWRRVSAIFREDGTLQVFTSPSATPAITIKFSMLKRSAVQRLHRSLFGSEFCVGIYPQYSASEHACTRLRPIILSFESRVLYEAWYVLFRAFSMPEIFGPLNGPNSDTPLPNDVLPGLPRTPDPAQFRIERSIHVRVNDARFSPPNADHGSRDRAGADQLDNRFPGDANLHTRGSKSKETPTYQVRMLIDGQVKAKTTTKTTREAPFWYESFDLLDLPLSASCLSFELWEFYDPHLADGATPRSPVTAHWKQALHRPLSNEEHFKTIPRGESMMDIVDLMSKKETNQWWPLLSQDGHTIGEISLKLHVRQDHILMDNDYLQLSELLHNFSNTLTIQIAERVPSELTRLSECLVDIFQVSGKASEWIMSVAEEEIDSTRGETQNIRSRFISRIDSNESKDRNGSLTNDERATLVRDFSRTATSEANLLFRGNTILTKSLDTHMKRLGRDYLEATLGPKLRNICEVDPECEVDPNKLSPGHDLQRNWKRLIGLAEEVWKLIHTSTAHCPLELRTILRHIRACAEDRYGMHMRAVPYSSVSGFLFLRFFCPAVLNPKIFGLVSDNPPPNATRAFTLLAKSLQTLANGSTFDTKQPWMDQMNSFLNNNKQVFKDFIDSICSVPSQQAPYALEPPYYTPLAVFSRLPPASKEGFPSLPHLIDHSRSFAALVELWLDAYNSGSVSSGNSLANQPLEDDLLHFHNICNNTRQRTLDAVLRAERSERHCSFIAPKWIRLAERIETSPDDFWVDVIPSLSVSGSSHQDHKGLHHLPGGMFHHPQPHQPHSSHQESPLASTQARQMLPGSSAGRSRAISSPPATTLEFDLIASSEDEVDDQDEGPRPRNHAQERRLADGGRIRDREWRGPLAGTNAAGLAYNNSAASSDNEAGDPESRPHSAAGDRDNVAGKSDGRRSRSEKTRFGLFARKRRDRGGTPSSSGPGSGSVTPNPLAGPSTTSHPATETSNAIDTTTSASGSASASAAATATDARVVDQSRETTIIPGEAL